MIESTQTNVKRPIASGKVSIPLAILIGIILCVTSLAIAFSLKFLYYLL